MPGSTSTPPLGGRYGSAVAIALLGLCPNIVLTTAAQPLLPVLMKDLHTSHTTLQLMEGMSNAGYAVGAVIAADLAQRFMQRRLFLGYQGLFVAGSVLAAVAPDVQLLFAGRVLQGFATGLMLVSALPPLVTRFGAGKLPLTAALVNIGLFGATTLGPLIGGPIAATGHWRTVFIGAAALGALGLLAAALGYDRFDPLNPGQPLDVPVFPLALAATVLPFFATGVLGGSSFTSPLVLAPFFVGIAALLWLIVREYRKPDALMPVEALSTQLPVTGTVVAMVAGAAVVSALELTQVFLSDVAKAGPAHAGLLFWPLPVGVLVASALFGKLLPTRWVPVLINVGMLALAGGAAVLLLLDPAHPGPVVAVGTALLGFGAGATVSPGLFLAALGVASDKLGRAFALVELLRSEAAFAVAPVLLAVAMQSGDLRHGVDVALVAVLAVAVVGLVLSLAIPALSGARLREPDLPAWLDEGEPALPSPTTAVHVRPGRHDDLAEPLLGRRG